MNTIPEYIADEIREAMEACNYNINKFKPHFTKGKPFQTLLNEWHRLPSQYELEEGLNLFVERDEGYTHQLNHISYDAMVTTLYDNMVKKMTDELAHGAYRNRI